MIRKIIVICLVFVAAAVYLASASKPEPVPIRLSLANFPEQIGEWQSEGSDSIGQNVLAVLGVDDYVNRTYFRSPADVIDLYIGYYQSQRQGDTIHSPLNCMPGAGWNLVGKDMIGVPIPSDQIIDPAGQKHLEVIRINRIIVQKGVDRQLVLYWYQSQARVVASEYWGKIYTVLDAIRSNRTDAALVRVQDNETVGDTHVHLVTHAPALDEMSFCQHYMEAALIGEQHEPPIPCWKMHSPTQWFSESMATWRWWLQNYRWQPVYFSPLETPIKHDERNITEFSNYSLCMSCFISRS